MAGPFDQALGAVRRAATPVPAPVTPEAFGRPVVPPVQATNVGITTGLTPVNPAQFGRPVANANTNPGWVDQAPEAQGNEFLDALTLGLAGDGTLTPRDAAGENARRLGALPATADLQAAVAEAKRHQIETADLFERAFAGDQVAAGIANSRIRTSPLGPRPLTLEELAAYASDDAARRVEEAEAALQDAEARRLMLRRRAVTGDPTQTGLSATANAFAGALARTGTETLRGIGIGADAVQYLVTGDTEDNGLVQAMGAANRVLAAALPVDPLNQNLIVQVGGGAGSMLGFLGAGILGRTLAGGGRLAGNLVTGAVGGLGMGANQADMADAAETPEIARLERLAEAGDAEAQALLDDVRAANRYWSFLGGLGLGATEVVPIDRMFRRAETLSGGVITRALKGGAAGAAEEGLQEFFQTATADAIQQAIVDPDHPIDWNSAFGGAIVGMIVGAGMGGVVSIPYQGRELTAAELQSILAGVESAATPPNVDDFIRDNAGAFNDPDAGPTWQPGAQVAPGAPAPPLPAGREVPVIPPEATDEENAILGAAGYGPEDIADMNAEERTAAVEEARAQGVVPNAGPTAPPPPRAAPAPIVPPGPGPAVAQPSAPAAPVPGVVPPVMAPAVPPAAVNPVGLAGPSGPNVGAGGVLPGGVPGAPQPIVAPAVTPEAFGRPVDEAVPDNAAGVLPAPIDAAAAPGGLPGGGAVAGQPGPVLGGGAVLQGGANAGMDASAPAAPGQLGGVTPDGGAGPLTLRTRGIRRPGPSTNVLDFIADLGGLKSHPDLTAIGADRLIRPGRGRFVGPNMKRDLDSMREAAAEAGYFNDIYGTAESAMQLSTPRDLLDLIDKAARGLGGQAPMTTDAQSRLSDTRDVKKRAAIHDRLHTEIKAWMQAEDINDPTWLEAAVELADQSGFEGDLTDEQIADIMERAAIDLVPETLREVVADDIPYPDLPPLPEPRRDDAAPVSGEAVSGGGEGQRAPVPQSGGREGEAPESQQDRDAVVSTFRTAKGSTYDVHGDGTTTRNKAARSDPGHEGQSGPQPRSDRTIYVEGDASSLSAAGLTGANGKPPRARVIIRKDHALLLTWNDAKGGWGRTEGDRGQKFSTEPAVGRYPLELWSPRDDVPNVEAAYSNMHAGNAITEIGKPITAEATPAGDQLVIPGAERIPDSELAQIKADAPLKPKADQRPADEGLFGDAMNQTDLVDLTRKPEPEQKPAADETPRGTVGMMIGAGEVYLTATGRKTTPVPKIGATSERKTINAVKRVERWLMENALAEAESRGDDFNAQQFRANIEKPSQADKDSAEHYLFDDDFVQPVPPSILKPITAGVEKSPPAAETPTLDTGVDVEPNPFDTTKPLPPAPHELDPLIDRLMNGPPFATIIEARKFLRDLNLEGQAKDFDEKIEQAAVMAARRVMLTNQRRKTPWTAAELYARMQAIYANQPKLTQRTGKSMADQAYSTPIPLAFVASRLAGIGPKTTVFEPTAGNGALLIEASLGYAHANEINKDRRDALKDIGFTATMQDATEAATIDYAVRHLPGPRKGIEGAYNMKERPYDVVIANPPFGAVRDGGESKVFEADGFKTTNIDHAITFNALKALKNDGRAVLIVAGVNPQNDRAEGYRAQAKRKFYTKLYGEYRVVDHFTVAGDLYAKQGASWPVDVIVIEGRGKSDRSLPAANVPTVYSTWGALEEKLDGEGRDVALAPAAAEPDRGAAPDVAPAVERPGVGNEPSVDEAGGSRPDAGEPAAPAPTGVVRAGGDSGQSRPAKPARDDGADVRPAGERDGGRPDLEPVAGGNDVAKPAAETHADRLRRLLKNPKLPASQRGEIERQLAAEEAEVGQAATGLPVIEPSAPPKPRQKKELVANAAGQMPYNAHSTRGTSLDTLVPANLAQATDASVARVEQRRGHVDQFVADALGYEAGEIGTYFSAEQIDALALAIDNYQRGGALILGDQTGIGKGRVVAGMLRYAKQHGLTPVFFTEKPDLYGDMFRDLTDIGVKDLDYYMTNVGVEVPLDADAVDWKEESMAAKAAGEKPPPKRGKFFNGGSKPANAKKAQAVLEGTAKPDVIFTTYDQTNDDARGTGAARRAMLEQLAPNAFIVLDEAHNAGGQEEGRRATEDKKGRPLPATRSDFVRGLLSKARGVMYSSATFAKRPQTMTLYHRTEMSRAVEDPSKLPELITKGGVPLQQVVSGMLSRAGQYIRRERSFEGVTYNVDLADIDQKAYSDFTDGLRAIYRFDRALGAGGDHSVRAALIQKVLDEVGADIGADNATGETGADATEFSSIMHNLIGQMLLSIKVDKVADKAIEALKAGQKPVITVANTMESFVTDYADDRGLKDGDPIDIGFKDVMTRYLERTLRVSVKTDMSSGLAERENDIVSHLRKAGFNAYASGGRVYVQFRVDQLPKGLQKQYREVEEALNNSAISAFPVSPIDRLRDRVREAGYTVAEITGRSKMIENRDGVPTLVSRPKGEVGNGGKIASKRGFNGGKLDVLILNQSGSTGISLHASPKEGKDTRPRHMIVAQAHPNIDVHMQTLGRIHRTGQIHLPTFTQFAADIPAEVRPTAVLMKKMASLNANTTAARKSTFSSSDVDIMNSYGDRIAATVMHERWEWNEAMGEPVQWDDKGRLSTKEPLRRVLGRIVMLDPAEQRQLIDELQNGYQNLIKQLDSIGENMLEAKTMDLQAETMEFITLVEAKGDSPFEEEARFEKVKAKSPGRAMAPDEVVDAANETVKVAKGTLPKDFGRALSEIERAAIIETNKSVDAVRTAQASWLKVELAKLKDPKAAEALEKRAAANLDRWTQLRRMLRPGVMVQLASADGDGETKMPAVVVKVERAGKANNPAALGTWEVSFAVPDSSRLIIMPFSQVFPPGVSKGDDAGMDVSPIGWEVSAPQLMAMFEEARKEGKEERIILTGNILAGYEKANGQGQIVNYTTDKGDQRSGILMPRRFNVKSFLQSLKVHLPSGRAVRGFLMSAPADTGVETKDGYATIVKTGPDSFRFELAAGRATGGRYFTEKTVRAAAKERWTKKRDVMVAEVNGAELEAVVDAMQRLKAFFVASGEPDIAKDAVDASKGKGRPASLAREDTAPQIETPAFKRWFGDSKVVDRAGRPKVVYHGTGGNMDAFGIGGRSRSGAAVAYLTANSGEANIYAANSADYDGSPNVMPVYVKLENPAILDADTIQYIGYEPDLIRDLKAKGHDGAMRADMGEIVVFEPTQIKSATGNSGAFDPSNPDIRASADDRGGIPEVRPERRVDVEKMTADIQALARRIAGPRVEINVHDVIKKGGRFYTSEEYDRAFEAAAAVDGISSTGNYLGLYTPGTVSTEAVIDVALSSDDPLQITAHESWHAVQHAFLTNEERRVLLAEVIKPDSGLVALAAEGTGRSEAFIRALPLYEIEAYAFESYWKREEGTAPARGIHFMIRRGWDRVVQFLDQVRDLLTRRGETWETIFRKALRGQYAATRSPDYVKGVKATNENAYWLSRQTPLASMSTSSGPFTPPAPSIPPAARNYLGLNVHTFLDRVRHRSDKIRVSIQDRMLMFRRVQEAIEAETGMKMPTSLNVYMAESLFPRAGEYLDDLRSQHLEPLVTAMRKAGINQKKLDRYLMAKHAPERNAEIALINPGAVDPVTGDPNGSGMTDAEASAILSLASAKRADYEALAKRVYAIRDLTIDRLVRYGLLSRDTADEWTTKYQNYVPLRGWELGGEESDERPRSGRGFDIRGPEAFRALGRSTIADSPMAYILLQAQQAVIRGEKNLVLKTLHRLIQAHPNPGLWKITRSIPSRALDKNTGLVKTVWSTPPGYGENADRFHALKIGGKTVWIEFVGPSGAQLSRAMHGIVQDYGPVIRAFMKVARVWASMQTSRNPNFVLPNMARDLTTAISNISDTKNLPKGIRTKAIADAVTLKSVRGIIRAVRNPKSNDEVARYYEEFRHAGGKTSMVALDSVDDIKNQIGKLFKEGKVRAGLKNALRAVDHVSNAVENGIRLSLYIQLRKGGFSQTHAASITREVTVNFNRRGEMSPILNSLYIFFNASVQGGVRIIQAATRSRKVQAIMGVMVGTGVLLDYLNYMIADDDDEERNRWDAVEDHIKERNLVIMLPGGKQLMIPLPYGYNAFFVAGQQLGAMLRGQRSFADALGTTLNTFLHAFNPLGAAPSLAQFITPTLLDPIVQLGMNETFYGGSIMPSNFGQDALPQSETYWEDTPQAYIDIAKALNAATGGTIGRAGFIDVSPEAIQHMVEFGIGGVGRFASQGINLGLDLIQGEPIEPDDIPILYRFFSRTTTATLRYEFWNAWDVVEGAHFEVDRYRDAQERELYEEARVRLERELRLYPLFNSTKEILNDIRDQRTLLERNTTISDEQRAARLQTLEEREQAAVRRALEAFAAEPE